jgi:hypothetical protein
VASHLTQVASLLRQVAAHLPLVVMLSWQVMKHFGKVTRHLALKIHHPAQVPTVPTNHPPHYCAFARLRVCAFALELPSVTNPIIKVEINL